jgi:hypothetical protein
MVCVDMPFKGSSKTSQVKESQSQKYIVPTLYAVNLEAISYNRTERVLDNFGAKLGAL